MDHDKVFPSRSCTAACFWRNWGDAPALFDAPEDLDDGELHFVDGKECHSNGISRNTSTLTLHLLDN